VVFNHYPITKIALKREYAERALSLFYRGIDDFSLVIGSSFTVCLKGNTARYRTIDHYARHRIWKR
jgi:hypothetical protein